MPSTYQDSIFNLQALHIKLVIFNDSTQNCFHWPYNKIPEMRVSKMAQTINALANNIDDLSLILSPKWWKRTMNSHEIIL